MGYSLKQLKVFVTVAQEKSFSRTGERIGLSQSAVSHSMKELEDHTGIHLLGRTTREMMPTDAERQLTLRFERLLDELNSTLCDTGRVGQQPSGKARVTTGQTISAHLTSQCIAENHRRYPDIQFALHDRPQQWAMESIRQGDVDLGIVIDPGPVGDLQYKTILSEPFSLLCHCDSTLTMEDYVPWQALQGAKLASQGYASGSRPLIDAALARDGIQANIVQEIGHPMTPFPMVAAGISINIFPALALPLPEGSPLVVERITPVTEHQLMLVCRKNRSLSTATQALWGVIQDQGDALMTGREGDPLYQIQSEFILPRAPAVIDQKLDLME